VDLVEEFDIPELTNGQIEELCSAAENAARRYILTKVRPKMVEKLDISIEAEGTRPLKLSVEVDLTLSSQMSGSLADVLSAQAVKEALKASDNYLRKIK
jgi:hypothetical protein